MRKCIQDAIATYGLTVNERGIITNPGKFEGEPSYVPALWDAAIEGRSDRTVMDGETEISCFQIDEEIAEAIGEAGAMRGMFVCLWEDDQGFVFSETWSEDDLTKAEADQPDDDEREAFTAGYVECALWCGVMSYKHDDECPCHDASENHEPYDANACTCTRDEIPQNPELISYEGNDLDDSDLADDARETLTRDAESFYASNVADLHASTLTMEQAGHDFWLTRNRHGAGFWDRKSLGRAADAALDRLTKASHAEGEQTLIVGDDGKVSVL